VPSCVLKRERGRSLRRWRNEYSIAQQHAEADGVSGGAARTSTARSFRLVVQLHSVINRDENAPLRTNQDGTGQDGINNQDGIDNRDGTGRNRRSGRHRAGSGRNRQSGRRRVGWDEFTVIVFAAKMEFAETRTLQCNDGGIVVWNQIYLPPAPQLFFCSVGAPLLFDKRQQSFLTQYEAHVAERSQEAGCAGAQAANGRRRERALEGIDRSRK